MSSFVNLFGTSPIVPANPSYEALTIAANTALYWPTETMGGNPYVAQQIDVSATAANVKLMMPPGNTGSPGIVAVVSNVGAITFQLTDQAGNLIANIATGFSWLISLTDNTTPNGSWRALQLAAVPSAASAAALAGPGLQAVGTQLRTIWNTTTLTISGSIIAADHSDLLIWAGGTGTLQFNASASLTPGFFCAVANQGTGPLTLSTTGGDTINGLGDLVIQPGQSGIIVCEAGGFNTIGTLLEVVPLASGGTGATSAAQALVNLGGSSIGISIFSAPSAAAILGILGINNASLTEATVSTNQILTATSKNTAFVCTAALTMSLPLSTTQTLSYAFAVLAQGGAVTITPQATDAINGGVVGASITVPQGASCYVFTDVNGNWWTFFGPSLTGSQLLITGNAQINGALGANSITTPGPLIGGIRNFLSGLVLSFIGTGSIQVFSGIATDSTNAQVINLPGNLTKTTAGAWVAGNNQPGLGAGVALVLNTWYHVFAIINGGTPDVYFDTAVNAANAPAGTTAFRRIGSFLTDASSHIISFIQINDYFYWVAPFADVINNTFGLTTSVPASLHTPSGIVVTALGTVLITDPGTNALIYVSSFAVADEFPALSGAGGIGPWTAFAPAGQFGVNSVQVPTNTISEVRMRVADAATTVWFTTLGWIDTRGKG